MLLSDAMKTSTGGYPDTGVAGRERPIWYSVASLPVESGTLDIDDLVGSSSVRISVPPGDYSVEARLIDFDGHLRISRLRARADGTEVQVGENRGRLVVEFGGVRIADLKSLKNGLTSQEIEELAQLSPNFANVTCDVCRLNFESKSVRFLVCRPGFGDGGYPVFALMRDDVVVGWEIEFIKDGYVLGPAR